MSEANPRSATPRGRGNPPCRRLEMELLEDRTLLSSWTPIGPAPILNGQTPGSSPVSGRIAAVAADPTDPNILFIAAAGGGVWRSGDAGASWSPVTDDQPNLFMGAIAVAPSNPSVVYAGTGEADRSGDSFYGRGVLASSDGGFTWNLIPGPFNRKTIAQIAIDPLDENTLYVAVGGGGVNGLGGGTGIWKSSDGGANWINTTTSISTSAAFTDVVISPGDNQTLFAGVLSRGVYVSTDAGGSWSLVGGGMPSGSSVGRTKIALSPADPNTIYVSIATSSGALFRMMKSTDGGSTWATLTSTPNYMGSQGWYDTTLAVDPSNANIVYAGGAAGTNSIIRSINGGVSWTSIVSGAGGRGPHVDHHGIGFDALGRLLDGNDGGIWRLDGTSPITWTDLNNNLQITTFVGIALHPTDINTVWGGSQDNGTERLVSLASGAWTLRAGGDGGFVRVDFTTPNTVYHEFNGLSLQRSDNGGNTWTNKTAGITGSSKFYTPYVMDPSNSRRLLLGTNRVWETLNRGDSWSAVGSSTFPTLDWVAAAGSTPDTIYATGGGNIYVTVDHGLNWVLRNPARRDSWAMITVDPTNDQVAYAVNPHFNVGANVGQVWATFDGGNSWSNISGNLPDLPAWSVALDKSPGYDVLYVGNDNGVFVSSDYGVTWAPAGDGLPNVQVTGLEVNPNLALLAAGTYGRGTWELSTAGSAPGLRGLATNLVLAVDSQARASTTVSAFTTTSAMSRHMGPSPLHITGVVDQLFASSAEESDTVALSATKSRGGQGVTDGFGAAAKTSDSLLDLGVFGLCS